MKKTLLILCALLLTAVGASAQSASIEDGDYLIVNAESGYYLAGGLYWGTCAMEGGRPQFMTLEAQSDGTYTIDSNQSNGGDYHYLGTNRYMDNLPIGWTIEEVDGGYTLYYDGTDADAAVYFTGYLTGAGFQTQVIASTTVTEKSVWKLVTKDEIIAGMANATVDTPVDVSALIPACEPKRNAWGASWTMTAYDGVSTIANGTLGQDGGVASCAESWHSSNGFDMHQIVTFPQAGYYVLTSQAFHDLSAWGSDVYPSMYAGDRSVEIYSGTVSSTTGDTDMQKAYQDLLGGLHPLSLHLYVDEANTEMEVGFTSNRAGGDVWTIFGELGLQYLGNNSYKGFVVHEEEAEVGDWSDGDVGTFHLNNWSSEADPSGMTVPFMEYWCGAGSTLTATTISHEQLTGLYPGMYEVSLDIRVLNENGTNVTEGTLFKANDASEDLVTGTDSHDGTFGTNDDVYGTYTLTCVVDANGTLDISIVIPEDVTYDWIAFKNLKVTYLGVVEETIEWEMTDAGWGTLILPFEATIPTDEEGEAALTLYAGDELTIDESTITVGEAADAIAANTPYLVKGTAGTYSFTGTPINEEDSYQVGMLVGTLVAMSLADGDFSTAGTEYVLQNHDDEGLAFYPITTESDGVTLDAYHCYLTGVTATALHLPGMATGIVAAEGTATEVDGAIYDLSGRRVAKAVKGVYIQNGKKVLVK